MTNINELTAKLKASLTRNRHNWSDSAMRTCDHCGRWEMTVIGNDEMTICASCCDHECASELASNLELAIEALEAAENRIAELEESHGNLREAMAGIHNTISGKGAYTPLAAILNASKRAYEESAAAVGIKLQIEGE